MATLGALKSRIATDLARTDLTDSIANAIADAVDEYGDTPFYWLMEETDGVTTASEPTLALPTNFRRLVMVTVTVGTQRRDLPPERCQITYDEYRARNWDSTARGEPSEYAIWNGTYYFDPVPDAAYTITTSYFGPLVGVPASDTDSNAWTTDAEQMIRAKAKALLFRDVIRNLEQAQVQDSVAAGWERKHLSRSAAQQVTYRTRPRYF